MKLIHMKSNFGLICSKVVVGAIEITPVGIGTNVPMFHQLVDPLYKESPRFLLDQFTTLASTFLLNLNLCPSALSKGGQTHEDTQ
jgi:hypothetical protein